MSTVGPTTTTTSTAPTTSTTTTTTVTASTTTTSTAPSTCNVQTSSPASIANLNAQIVNLGGMLVANVTADVSLNGSFQAQDGPPRLVITGPGVNQVVLDAPMEQVPGSPNSWRLLNQAPGRFQSGMTYFFEVKLTYDIVIRNQQTSKSTNATA